MPLKDATEHFGVEARNTAVRFYHEIVCRNYGMVWPEDSDDVKDLVERGMGNTLTNVATDEDHEVDWELAERFGDLLGADHPARDSGGADSEAGAPNTVDAGFDWVGDYQALLVRILGGDGREVQPCTDCGHPVTWFEGEADGKQVAWWWHLGAVACPMAYPGPHPEIVKAYPLADLESLWTELGNAKLATIPDLTNAMPVGGSVVERVAKTMLALKSQEDTPS